MDIKFSFLALILLLTTACNNGNGIRISGQSFCSDQDIENARAELSEEAASNFVEVSELPADKIFQTTDYTVKVEVPDKNNSTPVTFIFLGDAQIGALSTVCGRNISTESLSPQPYSFTVPVSNTPETEAKLQNVEVEFGHNPSDESFLEVRTPERVDSASNTGGDALIPFINLFDESGVSTPGAQSAGSDKTVKIFTASNTSSNDHNRVFTILFSEQGFESRITVTIVEDEE